MRYIVRIRPLERQRSDYTAPPWGKSKPFIGSPFCLGGASDVRIISPVCILLVLVLVLVIDSGPSDRRGSSTSKSTSTSTTRHNRDGSRGSGARASP